MTQQQFIEEVKRLSVAERIALMEIISRSLREDIGAAPHPGAASGSATHGEAEFVSGADDVPLSRRLYGIISFEGRPPTDEEVKDMYVDYLSEKYS